MQGGSFEVDESVRLVLLPDAHASDPDVAEVSGCDSVHHSSTVLP